LVGSEAVDYFSVDNDVIGIDNNMRCYFFGTDTKPLKRDRYIHYTEDIRKCEHVFEAFGKKIDLIIHTAAQPSHDWAAREPLTDFGVNAEGTLKLLEWTRIYCPDAVFIYCSTNKVYGDRPNIYEYDELEKRFEPSTAWFNFEGNGFGEYTPIDNVTHSLFGCSKLAGDIYTQEYGRYFRMKTGIFRAGCITGGRHQGSEQHGFLSYLFKCCKEKKKYTIYGHKGKQVRDNIHAHDLVKAFDCFYKRPKIGEVYNIGGGRHSNCSVLEAIELIEKKTGNKLNYCFGPERKGDHKWWISDCTKFKTDYPEWEYSFNLNDIINDLDNISAR